MGRVREPWWLKFVMGAVVVAMVGVILWVGAAKPAEEVRYGGQYYPGEFVLQGFPELWGSLGVEHILFSSGTENNMALISGAIDVNCGSDSKTSALFAAIDDALIIGVIQRGDRYSTVVQSDSAFRSWEDLKGATVATRLGSGAEQVLLRFFEQTESLSWDDYNWVNLKVEDMVASLEAGQIAAFTAWEPTPAIAESQGIGRVIRSYGDIAQVPVCLHTTVGYAEANPGLLVAFLEAHKRKVALIESDPELAAQYAAEAASAIGIEVSPDAFLRIFERVDFSLEITEDVIASLEDTAMFLFDRGKIDCLPVFRWDASFLED